MILLPPFRNEPDTNFALAANLESFREALARVRGQLGRTYPLIIGGREVMTEETLSSINPSHPEEVVGRHAVAGPKEVDLAVEAATQAFPGWATTSMQERVGVLLRAAQEVRRRRHELAAIMVYEIGKAWSEADGECSEVVDLLEWYARHALELAQGGRTAGLLGELTEYRYLPLGVGAVIAPWNFPLALITGMTSAALVCGNTVVLKPAETSSTSAAWLVELFAKAGLPPGVLNLATGLGEVAGEALVDHPKVRFVAFTGSKEVGVRIYERASRVQPGQRWLKRVQLELGGKNPVVVDETADLDRAAAEIVAGAFGFQGQKCSAGSRAILTQSVYEELVPRIVEAAQRIRMGDPVDPEVTLGPVIDSTAEEKILDYIEVGKREGKLLLGGDKGQSEGYFIPPTIFGAVEPTARIATEEIFGPVLAVMRAPDFRRAVEIANQTDYGLTGAIFSRDPEHIAYAKNTVYAGNLYVNRRSTGALMGIHPFGGFNMSGTDTKAGGPDYLMFYVQGQAIGERL